VIDRDQWSYEHSTCMICGQIDYFGLETHEIANGPDRQKALVEPAAWLRLCRECHQGAAGVHNKAIWPLSRQLALKKQKDPKHYDRITVLRLLETCVLPSEVGKGDNRVTEREVDMWRNCLSHWFPLLEAAGLPVPKTVIVKTDCQLASDEIPDGFAEFLGELREAIETVGGCPCFLRTGHTSAKHDWKDTCYLADRTRLAEHVCRLVEFSEMAGPVGLPTNVWAVRELLPTVPWFYAFVGEMPIVKEFRCFVRDGDVVCMHPYWPVEAIKQPSRDNWTDALFEMCDLDDEGKQEVIDLASRAGKAVGGDWSVDILATDIGWYVTDMAAASQSYHWEGCDKAKLFENGRE